MRKNVVRALAACALAMCATFPATGNAAWPGDQPINMIVAYAPGGGTDIVARAIVPYIEKYLGDGAKINIVNRAGAGGEIGFAAIASAPPDGYTIVFINTPNLLTIPIERKTAFTWLSYDLLGN